MSGKDHYLTTPVTAWAVSEEAAFRVGPWETMAIPSHITNFPALITGPEGYTDFITHTQVVEDPEEDPASITITNPHPYPISIRKNQEIGKAFSLKTVSPTLPGISHHVNWVSPVTLDRPLLSIAVEGHPIEGLMDTGADCSVVNKAQWKPDWPLLKGEQTVMGVGGKKAAPKAARALRWAAMGEAGLFTPLCLADLPYALWGRDVLSQLHLSLATPDSLQGNL